MASSLFPRRPAPVAPLASPSPGLGEDGESARFDAPTPPWRGDAAEADDDDGPDEAEAAPESPPPDDSRLQIDLLDLFRDRARESIDGLIDAGDALQWREAAHRLREAALGVGASRIAERASQAENLFRDDSGGRRDPSSPAFSESTDLRNGVVHRLAESLRRFEHQAASSLAVRRTAGAGRQRRTSTPQG